MPFAQNHGAKINYEVIGEGPPVILQHGLSVNLETWKWFGYVAPLSKKYKLLLIDARGHGKSDKFYLPEKYATKHMVEDITAVMDDQGIQSSVYWGYSMGGRIGLAIPKYAPKRFHTLIIGGAGLAEKDSQDEVNGQKARIKEYRETAEKVKEYLEKGWPDNVADWQRKIWPYRDHEALITYCKYIENIGMAEYLPHVTTPCLLYAGDEDPIHPKAEACADIMPNSQFISLPSLNHGAAWIQSSLALPRVLPFLKKHALHNE